MERVKGIEPSYAAWEAAVLPLNYTRIARRYRNSALTTQPAMASLRGPRDLSGRIAARLNKRAKEALRRVCYDPR